VRILVLNWLDRENPRAGGAEVHLHEIFGRIAAAGDRVILVASGWRGCIPRVDLDGIEVHRVGTRNTFPAFAVPHARRLLADGEFDVVVEDLNKIPLATPHWSPVPTVLLVHHLFGATAFRSATPPVAALTWLAERPIGRIYRGIPTQAISESTANDLIRRGLDRREMTIIPNGVDLEFFFPDPSVPRAEIPTLLYLGRLQPYKRVDLVLRAFALLRARGSSARLVVAGKGSSERRLRRLTGRLGVAEAVDFVGFVSEEEKRRLLRTAWVHVLTSPREGWGITNVEAAACGTPSVVSDSPGLRDSVAEGVSGYRVPHGDVDRLASTLGRLLRDRKEVERLGRSARSYAERFDWGRSARETRAHLARVIARPE